MSLPPSRLLALFLLQAVMLGLLLGAVGQLTPLPQPDTLSYERTWGSSWTGMLSQPRTPGYGLFLKWARVLDETDRYTPLLQYGCHVLACGLFWQGLRGCAQAELSCLAAASSLLYANICWRYGNYLTPDLLAASTAVAACGSLLLMQRTRLTAGGVALLGLLVTACWLLRPAYLFLVVFVPVCDQLLRWYLSIGTWAEASRRLIILSLICVAPLILWCGWRWRLVGSFRPVAFGGNHLAALLCNFADERDTPKLSAELQPLWTEIQRHRRELEAALIEERPLAEWFVNQRPGLLEEARRNGYTAAPSSSYAVSEARFVMDVWDLCTAVAEVRYDRNWLVVDRQLGQLGNELQRLHWREYCIWYCKAVVRGCWQPVSEFFLNPFHLMLLGGWGVTQLWASRLRLQQRLPLPDAVAALRQLELLMLLILLTGTFLLSKVLFIAMGTPPIGRFTDAAGVFLATLPAVSLAAAWQELGTRRRPNAPTASLR